MRIIYKDSDGVKVIIPSPHYKGTLENLAKKRVPEGCEYKIVADDKIPTDRYFRNAWDIKSGKVVTDITKAKELKKEYLRQDREPLLKQLDIDYMKAQETQADVSAIVAEKQRLRDITKQVDNLKTVDELKSFTVGVK